MQTRKVKCKRKDDNSVVADAVCNKGRAVKPLDEKPCNIQPCPPVYATYSCYSPNSFLQTIEKN